MIFGMLASHILTSINMKYEVRESPGDRETASQNCGKNFMKIHILERKVAGKIIYAKRFEGCLGRIFLYS